ncbi:hypothetical protein [Bartonella vinsonii]|uniref:Uncharacterized protein n=2 Tax=Bartonella vinsonii TaxID=33047 RepID=A0A3S5C6W2_BARVI|nr:hypothetical protein [Bartonella vinsonii]EJF98013.1 hypothetical protein MEI_00985 [Bartonella vinsonii subsp. arupensis Pm136co]VEJ45931.1 Uncharacterised protein [Bartonella vinsonii]
MMDKKQIQTSKDHRAEQDIHPQDQALDPAVERVRKKLMRLMIISISITLILILAVFFGVIYKIIATDSTSQKTQPLFVQSITQETVHHTLSLPEKTQILSQSLSDHNIVLKILTPEGQTKFMIYNYYTGTLIAVLSVETTEGASASPSR